MTGAHVEYVGFRANGAMREYSLLVRPAADEVRHFTLVIPNAAFLARRVRYQDAPEICFLKLMRELHACSGGMPQKRLTVTDADLEDYRTAHAPKPSQRRPRQPFVS
jgi:hypothetical protein